MADRSLIFLALVVVFYSLSSAVTGVFLPNYYMQIGLSVNQIILLTATAYLTLGLLPILTLRFLPKTFEKLLVVGIALNAVFYFLLISTKNPLVLGLVQGLSFATFWPAFNLLLFRFTDIKKRGMVVSLLYIAIPAVTSIVGPFFGGVFIQFLKFDSLFILGIVLLLFAFVFSLKIRYAPTEGTFLMPKSRLLLLFALIIALSGFAETSFIAYPLFLYHLAGGFLSMGILVSILSVIFAAISLITGRISQAEKHRINFAVFGMLMSSVWLLSLAFIQNAFQLVAISVFSGLSSAFSFSLFSLYGDFFERKQHATLVVLWEVFLMFGRMSNLIPVGIFINSFDFRDYFLAIGFISLSAVVPFLVLRSMHSKGRIRVDAAQK